MSWLNDDGLIIEFGVEKTTKQKGGESSTDGDTRVYTFDIDAADLVVGAVTVLARLNVPSTAFIKSAELSVNTAFAGGGTLDLGFVENDNATEIDYDGIDAAIATASMTEGDLITADGAKIGTTLGGAQPAKVMARCNTTAFSAGKARLTLEVYIP